VSKKHHAFSHQQYVPTFRQEQDPVESKALTSHLGDFGVRRLYSS
jgi:hypothetical protein